MQAQLGAHEVHQVGGVLAVEDRERRIHAAALGVLAQQPRADAVEGAGPRQHRMRDARPRVAEAGDDALDAARHLDRGAARERQQQDACAGRRRLRTRQATRCASVFVLPVPAPAMISSGPPTGIVETVARGRALFGIEAGEQAVEAGGRTI